MPKLPVGGIVLPRLVTCNSYMHHWVSLSSQQNCAVGLLLFTFVYYDTQYFTTICFTFLHPHQPTRHNACWCM